MTHNETTDVHGGAEAGPPVLDEATATRSLGQLPMQSEAPPPPLKPLRRRKLPIATIALAIAAAGGVGFYSGVRVEKGQLKTTANTGSTAAAFGFGGLTNARTGARANAGTSPSPAANATPGATRNGTTPTANGGTANLVGTVTVVDGNTLYITEANGDTVKVTTSDGTTVTKTVSGTVKDLAPGESVIIRGVQSSEGVYAAQTVTQASSVAGLFGGSGGGFGGGSGRANRSSAAATTAPN